MASKLRRALSGLLLIGVSTTALLIPPVAASAAVPSAPGAAGDVSGDPRRGATEQEPTPAELQQQQTRVAALRAEAERHSAGRDDAQQALQGAAVLAGQALEQYATAVRTLRTRQQVEAQQEGVLSQAQADVDRSRRELGRWARQAYTRGSGPGSSVALTMLLQADGEEDVSTTLTVLRRIGRDQARALSGLESAQRQADRAAAVAATASADAADAAVDASAAKQASDRAVNTQRRLLGVAESSLAQSNNDVSAAVAREAGLRAALLTRASLASSGSRSGSGSDNRVTGPVGSCTGAAVEQYDNGQIPTSALCALRAASGHYLRADAAYAFDRLGQAYADRFGQSICLTDSYRSYAAQVSVYARKPGLAAVPGTSNHGWGTAVDLCGGIQTFSSAQHRWMGENASLYGWFHPGWAQQGGSKPEPWHWEYGG